MQEDPRDTSPIIDVTLDGTVLAPPSRLSRLLALWRALPPGTVPGLLVALFCVGSLLIVLFGLALIAIPAMIVLGLAALLLRGLPGRQAR